MLLEIIFLRSVWHGCAGRAVLVVGIGVHLLLIPAPAPAIVDIVFGLWFMLEKG